MKTTKFIILLLVSTNIIISSCKCSKTDNKQTVNNNVDSTIYVQDLEEILLPSPAEVLEVIATSDFKYTPDILTKVGIEEKALLFKHKSLLLGVYVSDFAYVNVFNQRETGTLYFNSIQNITKDLGISSILNDTYYKRFENNINNFDSINIIFKDFSSNAYSTLIQSGNREILSMIAIGSVIEILYIGMRSIEFNEHNQEVISKILEHKAIYENYYNNFVMYNSDKEDFKNLMDDLNKIYAFFKTKVANETHTVVATDTKNHFIIKDISKSSISKKDLMDLYALIETTRTKILEMKY